MSDNNNSKNNTINQLKIKNQEIEYKILKLYNAVKIDKLKRKQEFENVEIEIRKIKIKNEELNKKNENSKLQIENEILLLKKQIEIEELKFESRLIKSRELVKLYNSNSPLNNSLLFKQLKELESNCNQLETNILYTSSIISSKTIHLNDLISSAESKIKNHNKVIEEKERIKKNRIENDLLLEELERVNKSIGLTQNILDSDTMFNLINNLENSIKSIKSPTPLNINSNSSDECSNNNNVKEIEIENENSLSKLVKANSFDSNNLHKKKEITSSISPVLSSAEEEFNKRIESLQIKKKVEKKQQQPNHNQNNIINSIQYPINVILNESTSFQLNYSLEFDTIQTLINKIYQHIESINPVQLKQLRINSIDQLSLKTSSNFYFSNDLNKNLKYVPYFSNNQSSSVIDIYITSKIYEDEFNDQISTILGGCNLNNNNNINEESMNFRIKMINYLDLINSHKNQLENEINLSTSSTNTTPPISSPSFSMTNLPSFKSLIGNNRPLSQSLNSIESLSLSSSNSSSVNNSPILSSSSSNNLFKSIVKSNAINISNNKNSNDTIEDNEGMSISPSSWRPCSPSPNSKRSLLSSSPNLSPNSSMTSLPQLQLLKERSINNLNLNFNWSQSNQSNCTIRLFITKNIIKTFVFNVQNTIGELIELIFKKFSKIIESETKESQSSKFFIKIRGFEIYLLNTQLQLSSIEFINQKSRRQNKIDLLLILKSSMSTTAILSNNTNQIPYDNELNQQLEKSIFSIDDNLDINSIIPSNLSYGCNKNFKIRIGGLKNFENNSYNNKKYGIKNPNNSKIYVVAQIYQGEFYFIGNEMRTPKLPISSNPSWLYTIEGPSFKDIPSNAILSLKLLISNNNNEKDDKLIGWVNYHIWNYKNQLNSGFVNLKLWSNLVSQPDPMYLHQDSNNSDDNNITLSFEIDLSLKSILFTPEPLDLEQIILLEEKYLDINYLISSPSPDLNSNNDKIIVDQIINKKDTLLELKSDEKSLIWKYRNYCKLNYPNQSISKLILSVPWNHSESVQEFYWLLKNWKPLDNPIESLELLSQSFSDRQVRKFAIQNLCKMTDQDLNIYLPQLIQAIKHEPYHYSILSKFLIRRVLLNKSNMADTFFWQIKSEILSLSSNINSNNNEFDNVSDNTDSSGSSGSSGGDGSGNNNNGDNMENTNLNPQWLERYELILEIFLRGLSKEKLNEIYKQYEMYSKIKQVAINVKNIVNVGKRKEYLNQMLQDDGDGGGFKTPVNSEFIGKRIDVNGCRVLQSKTMPLLLSIENYDLMGDKNFVIFKAGDDLRQDQLVLQMINIMDRMWLNDGIDLQTIGYKCIATGPMEGMIEVVGDSITIAEIQKQQGGITAAFDETVISSWLKQENPSDLEYSLAVENFIRSCAACCIYSYILGLGDRHNDNIMITKTGLLFHIDFGRFLGNVQTFNGIKRERAPFVFVSSFANVIGEKHFKTFEELCSKAYNVIRKHANVILNLFLMMIGGGLPELGKKSDIYYLRDALSLDLSDEQAAVKFTNMIKESLASRTTDLNFAVHILANPK